MSATRIGENAKKLVYDELIFKQSANNTFWSKFFGTAVKVKRDAEKGRLERMRFGLIERIPESKGIVNGVAEGNEYAVDTYFMDLIIDQHRQSIRDGGMLENTQAFYDVKSELSDVLRTWTAGRLDAILFKSVFPEGASTTPNYWVGGKTSDAGLTSSEKLDATALSTLRTLADAGKSRDLEVIEPIMVNGKQCYCVVMHPDARLDLRADDDFRTALENGWERGKDNPLFSGDYFMYDNLIIYFDRRCPISTSSTTIGKGFIMGKDAICLGLGKFYTVEEKFDYQDQTGICSNLFVGAKKSTFNSKPKGILTFGYARTNVSGANNENELKYSELTVSN